jgi:hypothetical protein
MVQAGLPGTQTYGPVVRLSEWPVSRESFSKRCPNRQSSRLTCRVSGSEERNKELDSVVAADCRPLEPSHGR